MTDYLTTDSELEAVADAIRAKGATSALLVYPTGFVSAINAIPTGITPTGTKSISISAAGTTTEDVTNYASAEITVPSGSAATPATAITANPTISVNSSGLITATVNATKSVTPSVSAGYVSSGTAGTVSVSGSNASQLTVYAGAHHTPTPAGYTVTISLTNPSGVSHFGEVGIFEAISDDPWQNPGSRLGVITTATGSTTVSVPSSVYGIHVIFDGSWIGYGPQYATTSCTGGVSHTNGDANVLIFAVTGDGTATIDGVDWENDY